jgi:hypothetical protein
MDKLYKVFDNDNKSTRDKKLYLRNVKELTEDQRSIIVEAYIGDSLGGKL